MLPEAPFFFSIAGLSASLAGLAGLVAGLRRGADLRPLDLYRLRQIVEFSFANIVISLGAIPLTSLLGLETGLRSAAGVALAYAAVSSIVLVRRLAAFNLALTGFWRTGALALNTLIIVGCVWTLFAGTVPPFEVLLLALFARPMFAFLLVLASFDR